jgi:hypothetical protein
MSSGLVYGETASGCVLVPSGKLKLIIYRLNSNPQQRFGRFILIGGC